MNEELSYQLLTDIAACLPDATLSVDHRGRLNFPGGASIYLRHERHKETHIHVSVAWPRDSQNNYYHPRDYDQECSGGPYEMNVAVSKGAPRIAQEIGSRLLPHYLNDFNVMKLRADASDEYGRKTKENAAAFAAQLDLAYHESSHSPFSPSIYFDRPEHLTGINGTAKFAGEHVELEILSLSLKEAVALVRHLRELRQQPAVRKVA